MLRGSVGAVSLPELGDTAVIIPQRAACGPGPPRELRTEAEALARELLAKNPVVLHAATLGEIELVSAEYRPRE
jgi:hypothetical protein